MKKIAHLGAYKVVTAHTPGLVALMSLEYCKKQIAIAKKRSSVVGERVGDRDK